MTAEQLFYKKFSLLTDQEKAAVLLVIETFLGKTGDQQSEKSPQKKKRGGYGSLKGKIKMAPDFDEPFSGTI